MQKSTPLLFLMLAAQSASLHSMERFKRDKTTALRKLIAERNNSLKWAAVFALGSIAFGGSIGDAEFCPTRSECAKNIASSYSLFLAGILAGDAFLKQCHIWTNA